MLTFIYSFGPALTYLVDFFRLSDSLAGATLLALGNGAPDLIGDFQDYENDTEMLYAILYGNAKCQELSFQLIDFILFFFY